MVSGMCPWMIFLARVDLSRMMVTPVASGVRRSLAADTSPFGPTAAATSPAGGQHGGPGPDLLLHLLQDLGLAMKVKYTDFG